ncbi:MAG: hypothetical protein VB980_03630 [Opitutales bacterium]|jgi:hypothetical protein
MVSDLKGEVSAGISENEKISLRKGRFLSRASLLSTKDEEGIELLGGGWLLRIGRNTLFSPADGGIHLQNGTVFGRQLRDSAELVLGTSAISVRIQGKGSWLAEVMPDKGLRIIGITGKTRVVAESGPGRNQVELKSGQRVERLPSRRFGKIVQLDLSELIPTSRLLALFPHPPSFAEQLAAHANISHPPSFRRPGPARVDVMMGLSYDSKPAQSPTPKKPPSSTPHPKIVDQEPTSAEESSRIPVQTTSPQSPPTDLISDNLSVEQVTGGDLLPSIPGPPPVFHNRPKPAPTLKEVFEQAPPPLSLPGRIFDR